MRKLVNLVIFVPLALVLVLLSVANRQYVTFSLDPTSAETPILSFSLPFFVFLFIALFIGILLGGTLTWVKQGKHRKAAREKTFEANMLKQENAAANGKDDAPSNEIAPGLPAVRHSA